MLSWKGGGQNMAREATQGPRSTQDRFLKKKRFLEGFSEPAAGPSGRPWCRKTQPPCGCWRRCSSSSPAELKQQPFPRLSFHRNENGRGQREIIFGVDAFARISCEQTTRFTKHRDIYMSNWSRPQIALDWRFGLVFWGFAPLDFVGIRRNGNPLPPNHQFKPPVGGKRIDLPFAFPFVAFSGSQPG